MRFVRKGGEVGLEGMNGPWNVGEGGDEGVAGWIGGARYPGASTERDPVPASSVGIRLSLRRK